MHTENTSVIEFAQQIRKRPSMYFGQEITLSNLEYMLYGFGLNAQKESMVPFQYFNYWVKFKLNKYGSTYNWKVAILEYCDGNQEKGFWKFYELLDEFIELRPQKISVANLYDDNFSFYYSEKNKNKSHRIVGDDNKFILTPAPYQIKLVDFGYCVHSYHYDYQYRVNEYQYGLYSSHFDNLEEAVREYQNQFGVLRWDGVDDMMTEYQLIINYCRNRRQNII